MAALASTRTATALTPGSLHVCGPALSLAVDGVCGRARALTLTLPHGRLRTPVFMPVGTQGTVKGLTPQELVLSAGGGLHSFMGWPRNLLTDSGGFQMVSLLALAEITEAGVEFTSPADGSRMLLTPEMSMSLQNTIGADIMMALDDVVHSKTVDGPRFIEATARTLRWIDRCIAAHSRPASQSLFGITQGGLDVSPGGLRDVCLEGLLARDANLPGYAIGGLAGGEEKDAFWRVVEHGTARLPSTKPRYVMGLGYPLDLVVCTALGADMFDCVYPTRTARFGTAMVHSGLLKLKATGVGGEAGPIDPTCTCYVCTTYDRAYLHALLKADSPNGPQLVTYHNVAYMMRLVREMRDAVIAGEYGAYVRGFLHNMFGPHRPGGTPIPGWVVDACKAAGIDATEAPPPAWAAKFTVTQGSVLVNAGGVGAGAE